MKISFLTWRPRPLPCAAPSMIPGRSNNCIFAPWKNKTKIFMDQCSGPESSLICSSDPVWSYDIFILFPVQFKIAVSRQKWNISEKKGTDFVTRTATASCLYLIATANEKSSSPPPPFGAGDNFSLMPMAIRSTLKRPLLLAPQDPITEAYICWPLKCSHVFYMFHR